MAIMIHSIVRSNRTNMMDATGAKEIKIPIRFCSYVDSVGIELVRKFIMKILLDDYGTKVGMRYGSRGSNRMSTPQQASFATSGWDARIAYFMGIMRKLGYSNDEDEYLRCYFQRNGN